MFCTGFSSCNHTLVILLQFQDDFMPISANYSDLVGGQTIIDPNNSWNAEHLAHFMSTRVFSIFHLLFFFLLYLYLFKLEVYFNLPHHWPLYPANHTCLIFTNNTKMIHHTKQNKVENLFLCSAHWRTICPNQEDTRFSISSGMSLRQEYIRKILIWCLVS